MTEFIGKKTRACTQRRAPVEPAFWCEKEVATYLGVSVQLLRKCRANGTGPGFHKIEGCIRYPIAELKEYVVQSRCQFTGQHSNENRPVTNKATKEAHHE